MIMNVLCLLKFLVLGSGSGSQNGPGLSDRVRVRIYDPTIFSGQVRTKHNPSQPVQRPPLPNSLQLFSSNSSVLISDSWCEHTPFVSVTQRVLKRFGFVGLKGMKGSKALFTLAQKTKNLLSSNWHGQLNTIKADAKGSKEEIYSSRVKYMFKKDKPYIWVPEDDLHNVNAMIDERSSFSVTMPFPGPLGSILKAMKKSPARVALTGDVIALKEKRVRLANEMIRESMLVEHDTISNSCYAVSGVLSSSNLGFTSRSECLLELLDGEVQYMVYKLDLRSCAFIDINGCTHDVDLEVIAAAKADPIAPFTAALIDGINQSEIRRRALMLMCFAHFNVNVRDAFILSIDQTGFDIVGKVPSSKLNDCGSVTYQWKEFRIPLKQEARDIGTFCEQLVFLEEETLKNLSSYTGLG
ncbi:unnamed protein product [Rhodiola kirilowii]